MAVNPRPFTPVNQFPTSGRPPATVTGTLFEPVTPPPGGPPVGQVGVTGPGVVLNCGAGTYWDPVLQQCVVLTPTVPCASGFVWSASRGTCVPISDTGVTTSTGTGTSGDVAAEGPIYVNVANQVTVADNSANTAVREVAGAVSSAINGAAQSANTIAQNTATAIGNQLDSLTGTLTQSITNAQNNIGYIASGLSTDISNTLGGLGSAIAGQLFNTLNPVSVGLGTIVATISQQIGGLAGAIGSAVAAVIPSIIAAVTGAISPSQAVLQTISAEIGRSATTLAQIGSDIAGGFGGLEPTLQRILTSWELYNSTFVESQTGYGDGQTLHKDLSGLAETLAGLVGSLAGLAEVKLSDEITAPCNSSLIQTALDKSVPLTEFDNSWMKTFVLLLGKATAWLLKGLPAVQKVNELATQSFNLTCQSELLTPGVLVDAVQRGFMPEPQALEEAARGNLSSDRWAVLRNLAVHQMSPGELVEALYRGYITQNDYQNALQAQGWTAGQQDILRGLAVPQIRPATYNSLNELLQRGIIDGPAFDKVLQSLNFDDAQRQAMRQLVFRPTFQNEETEGLTAEDSFGALGVAGLDQAPESVQTAGAAEGLATEAVNRRWMGHWSTGSIGLWIDLYFRGMATYQQLQGVLRRSFIPDPLHASIVAGARPLIQFRTISRMVFLKILSPAQGKAYLMQHGYSDADADTLIQYALVSGKAPAAQVAKIQHGVSVGIAKEEYIDGSISAAQFYDVLVAHQFTPDGANTEIAVIDAHQAMLARKEAAQLIVDEYGAGLISEQVALAQLAAQGLTVAELAKYAHKIRVFRTKTAKNPTEAELLKMLKADIITADTYKSTLIASGYGANWADAFYQLGTKPSATTPPGSPGAAPAG